MKLSVLMASMAAAVLFTATGAQAADTLAKIAESGKITLAYRESSVPFSYLDGPNKPIGFSVELSNAVVEAVKKKLNKPNLQVALMPVTSQNRIPLITNGTVDLECGSTTNNSARGKDVAFAINHFYTGTRLLVKKSSKIKDYADLAKKTVASTTGTTNALVMRKYNTEKNLGMDIVLGKDHADSFLLVESDRAVAFAMDDILLFGLIANSKTPADFEVVGEPLQVEPYACMLPKDDPAFKKLVDDTFAGMMKSGEFEKLYNKWFMQPIPPKNVPLNLPMSPQLKENLKALSDKPAT
ncbi:transporter substrate-binding domain-containing protein [Variovorax sp. Varisp85]|jgi:glutamate/aspartate transport system substrate-binding protein|uniref:transporter substrate-binding domain-containing protein n=1 Tax=unclassified Variovorax TaxID=663243 RepID=UPI000270FAA6|nr:MULTISPECIES: transporter substrate-binding domain-containing protein [unclassified Variovorax]EJL77118.1 periplasmic component of amino acid ABC-type transporter/signal transduction system [Variovorax sp. CF313]KQX39552.1 ABC transporter substrate-binding protein [Variovorax sp. Root434]